MIAYQDQFDKFFDTVWEKLPDNFQRSDSFKKELKSKLQTVNKRLGQIIAKSWLHESDPEGKEIREVLVGGDLNETISAKSQKIIDFFKEKYKIDLQKDLGGLPVEAVKVNWDSFSGRLDESSKEYLLPYPPRPAEVTDEQLKAWIDDKIPDHEYPTTPYIPLTGF